VSGRGEQTLPEVTNASGGQETAGLIDDKMNTTPLLEVDVIASMDEIEGVTAGGDRARVTEAIAEGEIIEETVVGTTVVEVIATVGVEAATGFEAGAGAAIGLEVGLERTENTEAGGAINLEEAAVVDAAEAEVGEAAEDEAVVEGEVVVEAVDERKIASPSKFPLSPDRPLDT